MKKWQFGIILLAALSLAGCGHKASGPSAKTVLTQMGKATAKVKDGAVTSNVTVKASGETITNQTKLRWSSDPTVMAATVSIGGPKVSAQTLSLYQTAKLLYVENAGQWYKQPKTSVGVNVAAIQQTMTSPAFVKAAKTAKGTVTTKGATQTVTVTGKGKAMAALVRQVLKYGSADSKQVAAQIKATKIKRVTYKVTLSKRTHLPKRVTVSMKLTTGKSTMTETAKQTYTKLNAGNTVTIPAKVTKTAETLNPEN